MTIYVASFITSADYDALRVDNDQSMSDFANGFTCAAGNNLERVLEKAKEVLTAEMIDMEELTADDELVYGKTSPNEWLVTLGADPVAVLVIRKFEEA